MQTLELFYASVVDEFMVLAKNYGQVFSMTYGDGEHRDDYTFGITLSIIFNKNTPDQKTYIVVNQNGWNLGSFSGDLDARTMAGEVIAKEFSNMKSSYYGTIQRGNRDA